LGWGGKEGEGENEKPTYWREGGYFLLYYLKRIEKGDPKSAGTNKRKGRRNP